jgi:hypothetical protein
MPMIPRAHSDAGSHLKFLDLISLNVVRGHEPHSVLVNTLVREVT